MSIHSTEGSGLGNASPIGMTDVIEDDLPRMSTALIRHLRLIGQYHSFVSPTPGRFENGGTNGLSIPAFSIEILAGMRHDDVVASDRDHTFWNNMLSESSLSPILSGNQK